MLFFLKRCGSVSEEILFCQRFCWLCLWLCNAGYKGPKANTSDCAGANVFDERLVV